MKTKDFPSVILAKKAALAKMQYYFKMMKLAEEQKNNCREA